MTAKDILPNYVKGQLVIKLTSRDKVDDAGILEKENYRASLGEDVDTLLGSLNVIKVSRVSPDTYLIHLPVETDLDKARDRLTKNKNVERVDFNYLRFTR